ncbi:hypothetical protein A3D72_04660 [Candidatus Uhrbacteria bacterium RIFCSPHIGHO2_02_FULL_57_19]|uniref:Phosphomannomutase n=1 Tax=Candidatus Uhrbacteria bacterium RIFCSPHIGHO2_02_FULL_57_19 TaxID=1802391 RepID=A0A1F7U231_9BACT|nr:MAG: hypothetical protein A3D72_04660 [Candidatus Uhrbacteria bacterium RIFCSPHIGHO2_02_FULL_57_19]
MPKHIFFDLDSTLTPSRAEILPEHKPLFEKLCEKFDVVVITGGAETQIKKQLPIENVGRYYMLSQQGNHAIAKDGTLLWHEAVSAEQEEAVKKFALKLTEDFRAVKGWVMPMRDDTFENRGSQFASSVLGFHAPNKEKYAADPDQSIRRALLAGHPKELAALREVGIEAMPAGTTTIDFILAGRHKGYNITRFIERMGWKKEDCIYIGDALFKGGNDESVIGVIPTHPVKDHRETFEFIKTNLLQ